MPTAAWWASALAGICALRRAHRGWTRASISALLRSGRRARSRSSSSVSGSAASATSAAGAFEFIARRAAAWAWGDMKDSALLASSADADEGEAGGAFLFADPLAALVAGKAGRQGHHAARRRSQRRAIFHAHLLPLLVSKRAVDRVAVGAGAGGAQRPLHLALVAAGDLGGDQAVMMCTMTEEAEREDDSSSGPASQSTASRCST